MDVYLLRVHQVQVKHQCYAGLIALDLAQQGLDNNDQQLFWSGIQSLLSATANISKALWGQGGRLAAEREPLRSSLQVLDSSPLADTTLRNHLDHYDERLDEWYATSERHNHLDFIIAPAEGSINGIEPRDIFRHYDPGTGHVIFWGEKFSLTALRDALSELLPIAEAEASKPPWDQPTSPPAGGGS